ncbi:MAG: peptidoglycan editing factor PgeF [Patescibacteria group bacterium]
MQFALFSNFPQLRYGISDRHDGSMKLVGDGSAVRDARATYFAKENIDSDRIVSAGLVHGKCVERIVFVDGGNTFQETDGFVTRDPNTFLSVTVADCIPVYFFDPIHDVVGIVHAGWRGVVGGIVPEMIRVMKTDHDSDSSDILVGIGPSIQKCHFEITGEIRDQFDIDVIEERDGKLFVDLSKMLVRQLHEVGVTQIEDSGICTFCHPDRYFSYRRDKPAQIEAMVAWIGLDK